MNKLKQYQSTAKTVGTFKDITKYIKANIPANHFGMVNIFTKHTTCGIKILENEKLLLADYERVLQEFAPKDGYYAHNIIEARDVPPEERINGHSHIKALFFEPSLTIPVFCGEMQLGKWQSIFLVDLDPARERELIITII